MIQLLVSGIRLSPPEDNPVLLLQDVSGTKILPIWTSTVDAAAIAVWIDDEPPFDRPMTHDLLAAVVAELGTEGRVEITDMRDGVFYAEIEVGEYSFDARPTDAIALAMRMTWPIEVSEELMLELGVEVDEADTDEVERFKEFLDTVSPDDFEPNP